MVDYGRQKNVHSVKKLGIVIQNSSNVFYKNIKHTYAWPFFITIWTWKFDEIPKNS